MDDAHGTGIIGDHGKGACEFHHVEGQVDVVMGTFSKAFAVNGGFVSSSKEIIGYMRYFARSYMFSAAMPASTLAAVHAGLDLLEKEPERRITLWDNVRYATVKLNAIGFQCVPQSAIIALNVPLSMDMRKAAYMFHKMGIFINAIEYPAVSLESQRFRISIMSTHTHDDIDALVIAVETVWNECKQELEA